MPKYSCPRSWIDNRGGSDVWDLNAEEGIIHCRPCLKSFSWKKKSILQVHIRSNSHQKCLKVLKDSQSLREAPGARPLPFASDLAKMLATCNIPVNKVENRNFVHFIEKYTGLHIPSRQTIMKNMESQSKAVLAKISQLSRGEDLYVFWDEAKDNRGKPVAAVFIGFLKNFLSRPLLIHLYENKSMDSESIVSSVTESLGVILAECLDSASIKFFVADNFVHTEKAALVLKEHYPEMQYFPCTNNGAQAISQLVGAEVPKVNRIFIDTKRILKCDLNIPKHASNMSMAYLKNLLLIQWNADLIDF